MVNDMADQDHKRESAVWHVSENDTLDGELDIALATYAAAEPRAGLEERVLANLRAAREQHAGRSWWGWPTVAAPSAVVIVVAVLLAWRSEKQTLNASAHRLSTTMPGGRAARTQPTNQIAYDGASKIGAQGKLPGDRQAFATSENTPARGVRRYQTNNPAGPKLEQFPSPLPLSEQEKMLASYVTEYPEQAALVAQARTKALQRDREEDLGTAAPGNIR